MTDDKKALANANTTDARQTPSEDYDSGMASGVGGCMIIAIATPLGMIGGCTAGGAAFSWYYGVEVIEIQKHEPLAQWNWSASFGVCGGVASVIVALLLWNRICGQKRDCDN
ncbi:hypothetical protein [Aureliella helgolandensis]|uniref:Uncharacterized protein n=1 Tax=Aureliella helgolandensis TaxID=2527968 RepID=A0A518G0U3_9BACT|nr:hypothetical protein [Aureliella helgolandensis]QDV22225.1 hypothetical protein Q31a_05090 [Aureliella helgolandensis]